MNGQVQGWSRLSSIPRFLISGSSSEVHIRNIVLITPLGFLYGLAVTFNFTSNIALLLCSTAQIFFVDTQNILSVLNFMRLDLSYVVT